ncbi:MAG: hypothetical protein IPN16_24520 [Gemmatimonadetes bacterium]|nr:hypothetical protein [Gemmatimonadota bacterium]
MRSTLAALALAGALLLTVVLPAEYGIDPTGVGRLLGLTQMGEIKVRLAREAAEDAAADEAAMDAAEAEAAKASDAAASAADTSAVDATSAADTTATS